MKQFISLSLIFLLVISLNTESQYYSDRPLEMTFEHSDFFFSPSFLNPVGSANFGAATLLMSEQPLTALQRNPSNLSLFDRDTLTSNYFYIDFRNTREIVSHGYGMFYSVPMYMPGIRFPGWGFYHTSTRGELTPIASFAWLSRPKLLNNSLTMGLTYQLITESGGYYAIPYDIYRNQAGKTVDGMTFPGMEGYTITDRFSGSDEMYHEGHSINLFLSWELNDALSLGIKAGRYLFEKEGSIGSDNVWTQQINYQSSYWKTYQGRDQDYSHWDYVLGINYKKGMDRLGLYAGWINGQVIQNMGRDDSSLSSYGSRGGTNWSYYRNLHTANQKWDHSGNTFYTGIQWERQIREDLGFRLMYNYSHLSQDIGLSSSIESESENEYYYYYNNNQFSENEGFSNMHDYRTGSGERTGTNGSLQASMRWRVKNNQFLSVGAIAGLRKQSTISSEKVDAFSETSYRYSYLWSNDTVNYNYYSKITEDKTIKWDFSSRLRSIQIPVIFEHHINERFEILLGINRIMNFWKIDNQTLILYDYRERVTDNHVLIEEKTGERITEPRERLSIISTSFLGGVTYSPARAFSVQFIVSPGFEKNSIVDEHRVGIQYWLGLSLRP